MDVAELTRTQASALRDLRRGTPVYVATAALRNRPGVATYSYQTCRALTEAGLARWAELRPPEAFLGSGWPATFEGIEPSDPPSAGQALDCASPSPLN